MQRYLVLVVLVFSVICAKQILILNEEIVVALTFIGFVLYIETSFGNTIRESLQSRGVAILEELQQHMILQKKNIQSAINESEIIAGQFKKATKEIGDFVRHDIQINLPKLQQSLHFALGQQIQKQLTILVNSQRNSRNALQRKLVIGLKKLAQIQYSYSKGRKAQRIQFKQCFAVFNR